MTYPTGLQTALVQCRDIDILHQVKDTPTITMLEKAYGFEFASRVFVKSHIIEVNDFVGTKTKLSDDQLDTLSDQIVMEYGDLNCLEFICFCSRMRSGKYEAFYGSVDPMQITKSLADFYEDRRDDINRAWAKREKERQDREYEEHKKNAISFEEYIAIHPEQADSPIGRLLQRTNQQEERKKGFFKKVADVITGK